MTMKTQRPFFFLFSLILLLAQNTYAEMLSVKNEDAQLHTGPGETFQVKWKYGKGFPLEIVSQKGEWLKVSDFEEDTGWIYKPLLTKTPHMVIRVNKNQDKKVNIRGGPEEDADIVGEAVYGVVFETLEQKHGWVKVRHESGLEGWIKRSLLWGF
jgi:SH3-like domain-containing protein